MLLTKEFKNYIQKFHINEQVENNTNYNFAFSLFKVYFT